MGRRRIVFGRVGVAQARQQPLLAGERVGQAEVRAGNLFVSPSSNRRKAIHPMEIAARRRGRGVQVGVGIEPEHGQRPAAAAVEVVNGATSAAQSPASSNRRASCLRASGAIAARHCVGNCQWTRMPCSVSKSSFDKATVIWSPDSAASNCSTLLRTSALGLLPYHCEQNISRGQVSAMKQSKKPDSSRRFAQPCKPVPRAAAGPRPRRGRRARRPSSGGGGRRRRAAECPTTGRFR